MKLNEIINKESNNKRTVKVNGKKIVVTTSLKANELANFVSLVTSVAFTDGVYNAVYEHMAYRYAIIKYLTDIEVGDNVTELYDYTEQAWYDSVVNAIGEDTLRQINYILDKQIDYKIRTRETAFDRLCDEAKDLLNDFADRVSADNLDAVKTLADKLESMDTKDIVETIVRSDDK